MQSPAFKLAVIAALVLAVAGCRESDTEESSRPNAPETAEAPQATADSADAETHAGGGGCMGGDCVKPAEECPHCPGKAHKNQDEAPADDAPAAAEASGEEVRALTPVGCGACGVAKDAPEAEVEAESETDAAEEPAEADEPAESAGKRPADAVEFGGHYYKAFEEHIPWHEAKKKCEQMGGYLACVETEKEQEFITELADGRYLFLGATDEDEEGRFVWVNGAEWGYTCWRGGQPNNWNDENFLATYDAGEWVDVHADGDSYWSPTGYICEWDQ